MIELKIESNIAEWLGQSITIERTLSQWIIISIILFLGILQILKLVHEHLIPRCDRNE